MSLASVKTVLVAVMYLMPAAYVRADQFIGNFGFAAASLGIVFPTTPTSARVQSLIGPSGSASTCLNTPDFPNYDPSCVALFDLTVTTADVGQTFVLDSSNAQFSAITALLNTGFDYVTLGRDTNGVGGGGGGPGVPVTEPISSIRLSIETVCFSADDTCSAASVGGPFHSIVFGTITATTIPEPSSLALIVGGLCAMAMLTVRGRSALHR